MGAKLSWGVAVLGGALLAGACSLPEPYVFRDGEFNRAAEGFGRPPKDMETVSVCYNALDTTAEVVRRLAESECARYDKLARIRGQDYQSCALMTPRRAVFACVKR